MNWDRRKKTDATTPAALFSELPVDYLRLVEETLETAVEAGLVELKKIHPVCTFKSGGAIYADEVLLAITLSHGEKTIHATTVYASADFDPAADKPGLEKTLSACLDAAGSVFDSYLDATSPTRIAQIADHSLGALEDGPFDWTQVAYEINEKIPVWVKIDKSNPMLEDLTERWLRENDPEFKSAAKPLNEEEAAEFLEERLDAIKKAKSGQGGPGSSGPITH